MNKFSILLLDDVSENIYSLKLLIEENFDINIFTALKAQEAIEIVMNNTIDLILTDVQMPDIDGFQFAQYLKDIESTKDIPVIKITGIFLVFSILFKYSINSNPSISGICTSVKIKSMGLFITISIASWALTAVKMFISKFSSINSFKE